jgi:ATP-dependent helicase/nuclease subunit B
MRLSSVPPGVPFLDTLAARWLSGPADPERGLILLPTRRAARALAEAFLRQSAGAPMLLPRIVGLGALDEAPLALAGVLDLPPAVPPAERLAALASLVLALPQANGGARTADRAWMLARELALLMDEAERAELDLPNALAGAADAAHAEHWQITVRFLEIVTRAWPEWLAERGVMNPAARQVALLRAQARSWQQAPPADAVWAAGTTGAIPAVAELLRTVAGLPQGLVVLPGLDLALPEDAWEAIDEPHPQFALRALLAAIGARRGDVTEWRTQTPHPTPLPQAGEGVRVATLRTALLPAACLGAWRHPRACEPAGLSRLDPADPQEEAVAIAMLLRNAIETPGHRAALVTPDRALALRVSAELQRWGVAADDSAGEALGHTPPAVFLRLLAATVAERLAPVPLLALLKHPLAAAGLPTAACRAAARALELSALRGPRPPPGLTGLRERLDAAHPPAPATARDLLARLETCLAPLLGVMANVAAAPADALAALIEAGEALAATDVQPGPARLWAHEEGEALATLLAEATAALGHLPEQPPAVLPGLLDALLEGAVVRSRRALRGRDGSAEHPRIFIWGLLEARLQAVDTVVLGGLAEGVWPPATDPGPWLSRPMRRAAGLPSPELAVGLAAHDFVMAATSAQVAVLSCPRRRDHAPTVPSRWLARLDAYLVGQGRALPLHPAVAWARALDIPMQTPRPAAPPRPRPPAALRPRKLSVTEIETWLADPYAIYARHILRLKPLDPLEQETDALDYGILVHRGLELFFTAAGAAWPADARSRLKSAMDTALQEQRLRPALAEWWAPRLYRIADWVAEQEVQRRSLAPPVQISPELRGAWSLAGIPGGFILRGRADRIERRADSTLAILDYKTGQLPAVKRVEAGDAPQLPLEAAMAAAGAFGADAAGVVAELTYWRLAGGNEPGEARTLFGADPSRITAAAAEAATKLRDLIAAFDDPARPYLCSPHPGRAARGDDYAQLARKAEWDSAGDGT